MNHARKMVLIEPETLARFQNQQHTPTNTLTNALNALDIEMDRIMQLKGISDEMKWHQYNQVLQRYLHFIGESRQPLKIPVVNMPSTGSTDGLTDTTPNSEIGNQASDAVRWDRVKRQTIQAIPKGKKNIAELLYDTLYQSPLIDWDEKGRVIVKDQPIVGSSITDLISDVVRDRKDTNPEGWRVFTDLLSELNVPQEYISNTRRREFIIQKRMGLVTPPEIRSPRKLTRNTRDFSASKPLPPQWEPFNFK
jgi:hypothetical protein